MSKLYEIQDIQLSPGGINVRVQLNADHEIFKGHFPGQPVMPGVCMMELVCAVAERKAGIPLRITGGPLIKFLNMVDPRKTAELQVEMTLEEKDHHLLAVGRLFNESLVFVRFQLALSVVPKSSAALHGIS